MGDTSILPTLIDEQAQVAIHSTSDIYSIRNMKLDFPRFAGGDALRWIFHAEQFFDYYGVPYHHRLEIASVHFDGTVIPWFQRLQKSGKLTSWQVLTTSLERNYGPSVFNCPRYSLFSVDTRRAEILPWKPDDLTDNRRPRKDR